MKLLVTSLPPDFDKYALRRLFSRFGWVDYSKVYIDSITLKSTRKGMIEMKDDRQAEAAMNALQGTKVGESTLKIKVVEDKKSRE